MFSHCIRWLISARCLATLYSIKESYPGELTTVARQGSGSACRSLYGGFVAWDMGVAENGSDSLARQVVDEAHWPEMRVMILVANAKQKETSSTEGMQRTVLTSALINHRAQNVVPQRMAEIETAIKNKDFETFGRITMQDSNQFHAVCLDTYPPIFYLNDTSKHIIHLIHKVNEAAGHIVAAYTFDAGPNAVIYTLNTETAFLLNLFLYYYQPKDVPDEQFVYDPMKLVTAHATPFEPSLLAAIGERKETTVSQIIVSKVGEGAKVLDVKHTFV